ncbi:hypothetical protein [Methylorubrum extorquens]|nr:hypothetical protein [Methylorubrum extorquens]MCP1545368.1 hypothetical protein [Methylorubrum extorquens]MCP1587285.1 hypothetical protein [Methylorubrum extorquens]
MASDKSLAAEIEAVLRANTCELGQADEADRFLIVDVKKAAAEIAALQSRAFEDGARWMRERAYNAVIDVRHAAACNFSPEFSGAQGEARTNSLATAAKAVLALPLQPEGERNA